MGVNGISPMNNIEQQQQQVLKFTQSLCEALEVHYRLYSTKRHRAYVEKGDNAEYHQSVLDEIASGEHDFQIGYDIEPGKKYHKVIMTSHGNRSVHAFIDKITGEVYKPSTWKAPAKGVRYNLLDDESRENCYKRCDWSGGYLYK